MLARANGTSVEATTLPFGLAALDEHLPQRGLPFGALHEIAPIVAADMPAAFGFTTTLLGRIAQADRARGPVLIVTGPNDVAAYGRPYGHGLQRLGLDPARVLLVATKDDRETQWALEEALRSASPAAVAGVIEFLGFRASQRLHLAAENSGRPLLVLRPSEIVGTSVAMTRWRIGAAAAARDRFGLITRWQWRVKLERCRNGRPGEWLVEFDHAYRFSLAAAMADPALFHDADARSFRRAV
ncbi:ImuA family protein [Pseudorhodoplanes sinuspersici]|nr:ImuA protein [Pseudorhodoplanes sinuspersici]